jgi:hypothetical protein
MTTFTINEQNEIVAFATPAEAVATTGTPFDSFSSQQELAELAMAWPTERLVAIWNSLAGVTPVKSVKNHKATVARIWPRIQRLDEHADGRPEQQAKPKAKRKAKHGAGAATGTPAKGKSDKKARSAKKAPTREKAGSQQRAAAPREGSKTAQIVAMLQRKNGATLAEIMERMVWQKHTVRGFMAGAMKKAGYTVESFKPEGGERTYRVNR